MTEKPNANSNTKKIDGRIARSEAQQEAIKTAFVDLVMEGNFAPTAVDVANRTGISVRTVFRHFSNIDELYRNTSDLLRQRAFANMPKEFVPGNWESRLKQVVTRRRVVFEALLHSLEFMIINRHSSDYVEESYQSILTESRLFLELTLKGYVDQKSDSFAALVILFSPAHWRVLRMEYGLSVRRAERIVLTEALALYPAPDLI
ncbi:MAG: TetR/AcrR family transcriptional regulator [Pseudomonadota bacterium]